MKLKNHLLIAGSEYYSSLFDGKNNAYGGAGLLVML